MANAHNFTKLRSEIQDQERKQNRILFCFAVAQSAEIEKVHRIPNTKMNVTDLLKRIDEEASDVQSISRYLHEDVSLDLTFTTFVSKICQKIGSLIGT